MVSDYTRTGVLVQSETTLRSKYKTSELKYNFQLVVFCPLANILGHILTVEATHSSVVKIGAVSPFSEESYLMD